MRDDRIPYRHKRLSEFRHSSESPMVVFRVVDGLAQMTVIEVKRTRPTHLGLSRVLNECVLWFMELPVIANQNKQSEKGVTAQLRIEVISGRKR